MTKRTTPATPSTDRQTEHGAPTQPHAADRANLRLRDGTPSTSAANSDLEDMIRELLAKQRASWEQGRQVRVETYLEMYPTLVTREEAVLDLIYGEIVQRTLRGEAPQPEEYFERFPAYRERLRRQFEVHRALLPHSQLPDTLVPVSVPDSSAPGLHEESPAFIGKYRVIAPVGHGGQAIVYRAVHPALGIDVAIKFSRRPFQDAAGQDRLVREGRLMVELDHPNLARIYDLGIQDGRPFLVMEYVPGQTLEQYARQRTVSHRVVANLVARVAHAVAAIHLRGVVHHDIKPSNILIDSLGRPRLIDFGLGLLRTAWCEESIPNLSLWGSAPYMAPEQARAESDRVDQRADIFALGGILYFLLVGRPPFDGENLAEVLDRARRCDWDRDALRAASAPRRLRAICTKALATEPGERYGDAKDLAVDLQTWLRRPRLLAWCSGGVMSALLVLALLTVGPDWRRSPVSALSKPGMSPVPTDTVLPIRQSDSAPLAPLAVRVWRKARYLELIDAVPLRSGTQLRVCATVPEGLQASLFLVNASGQPRQLREATPASVPVSFCYPEEEDQAVPLEGRAGTEFVLVCGSRSGPLTEAELRTWLAECASWPALPGESVVRLMRDRVKLEQRGRDFGIPRGLPDPEGEIRRCLEHLRGRLLGRCDYFEGLAFAHQD